MPDGAPIVAVGRVVARRPSGDDITDDVAVNVGQSKIASVVAVGEAGMIEAEEGEHSGVHVMDMNLVLDGPGAEFISRSVDMSAFHAAAGHPD